MSQEAIPHIALELSLEEVEALNKTLGISMSNLLSKMGRAEMGTHQYDTASKDMRLLAGIQQELLGVIAEVSNYHG